MSIKANKIAVNTLFNTSWTYTPIHFSGKEFDIIGKNEWVYVQYNPKTVDTCGINATEYNETATVYATVYARTELRLFELVDYLSVMLNVTSVGSLMPYNQRQDNMTTMATTNGEYKVLNTTIYLKTF